MVPFSHGHLHPRELRLESSPAPYRPLMFNHCQTDTNWPKSAQNLLTCSGGSFLETSDSVKAQRVKTSENFSEESNVPRRFRRYPEILYNPLKVISPLSSGKISEMSSANIFSSAKFSEVFNPLRFHPLALSEKENTEKDP